MVQNHEAPFHAQKICKMELIRNFQGKAQGACFRRERSKEANFQQMNTAIDRLKNHKYYLMNIRRLWARLEAVQSIPGAGDKRLEEELRAEARELQAAIVAAEKNARAAESLLSALNEKEAVLMRARYIDGLRWKEIARVMHYSEERCYKIHAGAMRKLEAQWGRETRPH